MGKEIKLYLALLGRGGQFFSDLCTSVLTLGLVGGGGMKVDEIPYSVEYIGPLREGTVLQSEDVHKYKEMPWRECLAKGRICAA
jgi:hypothetical protein